MAVTEIEDLHGAYLRLTERFKSLWTFHQFLKGVHQTFLGDVPSYSIDFNAIYDRLRDVSADVTSVTPSESVRDRIDRIDTELALAERTLRLSDRALSPSLVRRFFHKIRPQDPKIVYHLMRFYLAQPDLDGDTADKIDFLATLAATGADGSADVPRDRDDAVRTFEAIASSCSWAKVSEEEVSALVGAMDELAADVARARSFEDLVRDKRIENIRTIKRRLGVAIADPRILASIGIANVRTRSVFRRFFAEEQRRIDEATERIEHLEREIANAGPLPDEFVRFRSSREEFARLRDEANVRAGDVLAMKHRIADVLGRFDLHALDTEEIDDALELDEIRIHGPRLPEETPEALTQAVAKVLAAVEMGDGSLKEIAHLALESWEVRAAKRAITGNGQPISDRDGIILEGAALRVRADEEAGQWIRAKKMGRALVPLKSEAQETLRLAADTDRKFSQLIGEVGEESLPEEMKALIRSRYRLLNSYTNLWLLHDAED